MCLTLCKALHIISLILTRCPHVHPISPFDIWVNWCSEKLRCSQTFTQPVRGGVRLQTAQNLYTSLLLLNEQSDAKTVEIPCFKLSSLSLCVCGSCFFFNINEKAIATWEFGVFHWKSKIQNIFHSAIELIYQFNLFDKNKCINKRQGCSLPQCQNNVRLKCLVTLLTQHTLETLIMHSAQIPRF